MLWAKLGAILLVLIVVFLLGNIWFHLVEWLLKRLKQLFCPKEAPPAWHPLPPEPEQEEKQDV